MTQNINVKKDVNKTLRTVMFPVGIITAVLGFVWFTLHSSGTLSTEIKFVKDMIEAGRYVAIPFAFLSLVLAALIICHASKQLAAINKSNIKWELTSAIINSIVGLLMLAFFIVIMTYVFSIEKWSYIFYSEELGYLIQGKKAVLVFVFMSILTSLALYVAVFGRQFNKSNLISKNTNIKMLRTLGVFTFIMALCNLVAVSVVLMGGFINIDEVDPEHIAEKSAEYTTAFYCAKFAIASAGIMAFALLAMVPLSIFGINDKTQEKNNTVMWSIFGGLTFILFVVAAAMITTKNVDGYIYPKHWEENHIAASVMVLLSGLACLAGGIAGFVKTQVFAPKIAKA